MRYDFHIEYREAATLLPNGLKVWSLAHADGHVSGMLFYPKATKPNWHYRFRTQAQFDAYLAKSVADYDASQARKLQYRAERKAHVESVDTTQIDPGAIFCYSWGYDQTNIEYWQVVARSGQMVTLREIGREVVPGSEYGHGMAESVRPAADSFVGKCAQCEGPE
jgi:hypothetical protein